MRYCYLLVLVLAALLAVPTVAAADEEQRFGPTIRGAETEPDADEDPAAVDAANRAQHTALTQITDLARTAARSGDDETAIGLYTALLDHHATPPSRAVAAAIEKSVVQYRHGDIEEAFQTIKRADQAAHNAESVPLWRSVRYVRTALYSSSGRLFEGLQFHACDEPLGPAEELLCELHEQLQFDADAFFKMATATLLYWPAPLDASEPDEYGLRLVIEPLLYAIHVHRASPYRTLVDDPDTGIDEELSDAYGMLLQIYHERDDVIAQIRVHLTLARIYDQTDHSLDQIERAEQLAGPIDVPLDVQRDLTLARAQSCLITDDVHRCRHDVRAAQPSTAAASPVHPPAHAAFCSSQLGEDTLPFCNSAIEYFDTRGDDFAITYLLGNKLGALVNAGEEQRARSVIDELHRRVDPETIDATTHGWVLPALRNRCYAAVKFDPADAAELCSQTVDSYAVLDGDEMTAVLYDALLDDLLTLAEAYRRNGRTYEALRKLQIVHSLALSGDQLRNRRAAVALRIAGEIHIEDRDAPMYAASSFGDAAELTDDPHEFHRLYTARFDALAEAGRWDLIADEAPRLAAEPAAGDKPSIEATGLVYTALAHAKLGNSSRACDALRSSSNHDLDAEQTSVQQRAVATLDDARMRVTACIGDDSSEG